MERKEYKGEKRQLIRGREGGLLEWTDRICILKWKRSLLIRCRPQTSHVHFESLCFLLRLLPALSPLLLSSPPLPVMSHVLYYGRLCTISRVVNYPPRCQSVRHVSSWSNYGEKREVERRGGWMKSNGMNEKREAFSIGRADLRLPIVPVLETLSKREEKNTMECVWTHFILMFQPRPFSMKRITKTISWLLCWDICKDIFLKV